MLRPLTDLGAAPSPLRLLAALRRAYALNLAVLAVPGLLLGVPLGLLSVPPTSPPALLGLAVAAAVCALLALGLAQRRVGAAQPGTPQGRDAALSAAIQAASAPAAPLLMACTALRSPLSALALLLLALLGWWAGGWLLKRWAWQIGRRPTPADSDIPDAAPALR